MRIPAVLVLVVASLALVSCAHVSVTGASQPSPIPLITSVAATSSSPPEPGELAAQAEPDGQFSLVVFDRDTGQVVASHNPSTPYPAESVIKLLIAVTALQSGTDETVVAEMLMRSDDDIADRLWTKYGGIGIVTRAAEIIGLTDTVAPVDAGRWGDTQTTADDLVKVYQYILGQAPTFVRDVILKALSSTTEYAADGFDQHFGIPDAAGKQPWAVKQGWACCKPDRVVHTTGLVGDQQRYIVVALSSHDASTTWDDVTGELTAAVRSALASLKP